MDKTKEETNIKNMLTGRITAENIDMLSWLFPEEIIGKIRQDKIYAYGAFIDADGQKQPLGVYAFGWEQGETTAFLYWFYVYSQNRDRGVGTFMMQELKSMLKNAGAEEIIALAPAATGDEMAAGFADVSGFHLSEDIHYVSCRLDGSAAPLSADQTLLMMHPEMDILLPRFFMLEELLNNAKIDFDADADEDIGPYFSIPYEDGLSVQVFILADADDEESFAIGAQSVLYLPDKAPDEIDAMIEKWEQDAILAEAGVEYAADIVSFYGFFPCEGYQIPKKDFLLWLTGFAGEVRMFQDIEGE